MIVGSGLLASSFADVYADSEDVWIYAAGVSNSACTDPDEYARERERLVAALQAAAGARAFVYFSTCSIGDPAAASSRYVLHKQVMETLIAAHPGHLIARLPQVAGRTPNPHTLLNYLYARISRSESFDAWKNALRNVIDVADVATTTAWLIEHSLLARTVNIANPYSVTVADIVAAIEQVVGKPAVVQWKDAGLPYSIDIEAVRPAYEALQVPFGDGYLLKVVEKYYG